DVAREALDLACFFYKREQKMNFLSAIDIEEIIMAQTASDIMLDTLYAWGVRVVFGIPGDGINGIIEAFRKREEDIRFIQVRHEEGAAFAATAYAKLTGKLGVCVEP